MKKFISPAILASLILFLGCSPKSGSKVASTPSNQPEPVAYDTIGKPVMGEDDPGAPIEYNLEEPVAINNDSLAPYNPSHTFEVDLIHEKVEISFDWDKKRANGKATLTMKPWFYPTDKVTLDAKNFDIISVTFDGKPEQLKYDYDKMQLTVQLGKTYTRNEEFKIAITYTAKPEERESFGGSAAITSDKGLYFINADGSENDKPKQIWTQGETESNSFWMPTIDKPNERCTQEMYITVEDKYKTLSNGLLVSSKKNADGTRTDYWRMDKPHAPYLFMMAIGEYAVVKDKWRGIDVDYYVEPKYEKDARAIFPYTTEMLEFFSNKLNYPYPWQKFSQVIVRDYVSGAMENTTAVVFGDFMQKSARDLQGESATNEKVVAHEMFHHWFGDLVTTESWANLTLNEGFANYSEYLWFEHKHGREAADNHLMTEQQGYILSAGDGGHPLIHYGYHDREDMFDAHSYNKGGCVLHMLRTQVGDDAFFTALNRYLKRNEFTEVEADELRLAFEDVTGQDLNWFFNQWFLGKGHPVLIFSYDWDEAARKASVTIEQIQEGEDVTRVFNLPLAVDVYDESGKATRTNIQVTKRSQTFYFDAPAKPALINVDAEKALLAEKTDNHTPEEWAFQYRHAPLFRDRWDALESLQASGSDLLEAVNTEALSDKVPAIRQKALGGADPTNPLVLAAIEKMAENDPDVEIRGNCIGFLSESGDAKYKSLFEKGLSPDQPIRITAMCLLGLSKIDPAAALAAAKPLENEENEILGAVLAELYTRTPDASNIPFFEKKLEKADGFQAFSIYLGYGKLIAGLDDPALLDAAVAKLKGIAMNLDGSPWRRFAATKTISEMSITLRDKGQADKVAALKQVIAEITANESDAMLKQIYEGLDKN